MELLKGRSSRKLGWNYIIERLEGALYYFVSQLYCCKKDKNDVQPDGLDTVRRYTKHSLL